MIDTTLASGTKSGYSFAVCLGHPAGGYAAWTNPVSANQTGVQLLLLRCRMQSCA